MSTAISATDVRGFIIKELSRELASAGIEPSAARGELDLFQTGILDSLGLLELFASIEERFGVELDFEDADPEQLTMLDGLCRLVALQTNARSA